MLENQKASFNSYIKHFDNSERNGIFARENSTESETDRNNVRNVKISESSASNTTDKDDRNSNIRRTQSMKSSSRNGVPNKLPKSSQFHAELTEKLNSRLEVNDSNGHCNGPNERNYSRINSYDPPPSHRSIPLASTVSVRRRYSFASGSSPYLDTSKRKFNCGRRILKAVEEDKILVHSCERRLGGGRSLSICEYGLENIIPETTTQETNDIKSELSALRICEDDKNLSSTDNKSKSTLKVIRRASLREFDTPLKVYNKKKISGAVPSKQTSKDFFEIQNAAYRSDGYLKIMNSKNSSPTHISSCQAIRIALSSLYNLDDFHKDKIGEGFFSEVFKVVHKGMGKVMVLKRNKYRANRNSMLKEVQLMNTLKHENILKYEGACVADGQLHALVEYINGGSLEDLIAPFTSSIDLSQDEVDRGLSLPADDYTATHCKDGTLCPDLSWSTRISLAQDISNGLSYLHSKGIFHRDLTSKNVLIRKEGAENDPHLSAVVADFGLAANIPVDTNERLLQVGSPYWMSPECLNGEFYDQKSDIFSFGIILCELIARCTADPDYLPRTANFGVDYRIFSESMVHDSCPPTFLKIAFRCVTIDPKSRPEFELVFDELTELLTSNDMQPSTDMYRVSESSTNNQNDALNNEKDYELASSEVTKSASNNAQLQTSNITRPTTFPLSDCDMTPKCSKIPLKSRNQEAENKVQNVTTENLETVSNNKSIANGINSSNEQPSKGQYTQTPQFRISTARSRRCVTQRNFPKYSPSEYARLHSPSSPAGTVHMFTSSTKLPVHKLPIAIGEEMSRLDPYYIPSPAQGVNPFTKLPLSQNGKIIGPKEMFCSCFELSEGMDNITSHSPSTSTYDADATSEPGDRQKPSIDDNYSSVVQRRAMSLVHPPLTSSLIHALEPIADSERVKDAK